MTRGGKQHALSAAEIHEYWTAQAEVHGLEPASSWSDRWAIELEIRAIAAYLETGLDVLDVGCATGYSTVHWASVPDVRVLGVDYVTRMVELAEKRRLLLPDEVARRIEYRVGDARSLDLPDASYDRVVSTRVVINLPELDEQRSAVEEMARVLRPGGLLLLSEATLQGWERLNGLRGEWSLAPIGMPSFNNYLDQDAVVEHATARLGLELVAVEDFASSYYVVTRVLKPLLAQATGAGPDPADPEAELNRWASLLPAAGDYGTQKLFVFRKPV